jgi:5-(carboxyamino)imidazole ribonucleotide mutase
VIGVPLSGDGPEQAGVDALLAIAARMDDGVPVACVGPDDARNAAVLAAQILSA